nr:hypothetical protein [Tanacetum cinerariifolium]
MKYDTECGRKVMSYTWDSDEDDIHDRDYDVAALANNLSQAFRYNVYDNDEGEEGNETLDRDDEKLSLWFAGFKGDRPFVDSRYYLHMWSITAVNALTFGP